MEMIQGGVTAAKGFSAASTEAEIKYKNRTDMAMVFSKEPCTVAGTFTSNVVKAACVQWDMKIVKEAEAVHAVVVNSGIANACTGKQGFDACEATAGAVKDSLGVAVDSCLVASTGVIGMQLPVEKLANGVKAMAPKLSESLEAGTAAAKAIMTTDTVHKEIAVTFMAGGKTVTLGGMSKGSGMIHPNMCTMLGFLTTDLAIEKSLLQEALSEVVKDTFNMITVDGDTSTNDTLVIMANGLAGNDTITAKGEDYQNFLDALFYVCEFLANPMGGNQAVSTIIMLVVMVGVFYFLLIRPENKRKKEAEQLRSSIKVGDKITTIGGIVGTVVSVKDEKFVIETSADQVRIELMKWALSTNESAAAAAKEEAAKAAEAKAKKKAEKKAMKNIDK